ncbi:MAG: aminodeoxychorismate synthase component I [Deltaproteobacteria bacterium]|nr:aminodeoxychorismate synthase component I [Deltaproteobacteria bacterium]
MHDIHETSGEIRDIHIEQMEIREEFLEFGSRFAAMPGTVLLMSGGDLDCARYHILGVKPWLTFAGRGYAMNISVNGRCFQLDQDPFDTLRMILKAYTLVGINHTLPIIAGLMGYLSYDLKDYIEKLPRTSIDDLVLPHICLYAPSIIVIRDKLQKQDWLCIPDRFVNGRSFYHQDHEWFLTALHSKPPMLESFQGNIQGLRSNFSKNDYISSIEKIRDYIVSGHAYQVNMSQRFQTDFRGDAFSLFSSLYKKNPAPFFAFLNAGDHQIISTSPERFLKRVGDRIETRPIKGTKPRGQNKAEDHVFRRQLEQSNKDDAELSMIVDLLRNDLGKVCKAGTVRVTEHKRVEAYENVFHLVSIVEGLLEDRCDTTDLIKAAFPGGSITGCPKIRAMEIIDELEPHRRHIYTGSIGYMSFHQTLDLSIAIRTATLHNGKILFSVGGGIVHDSDPEDEFHETLHKGKTLMNVFQGIHEMTVEPQKAWVNGRIQALDQSHIKIMDPGFQYGYGFFETIRVDHGHIKFLDAHMDRFNRTWRHIFDQIIPDLSWDDILLQVIRENRLENEVAAVKLIAARGTRHEPPFDHNIIVFPRPYKHRLDGKNECGLKLATYPEARHTPLADHKTLNYLYYYLAGQWAMHQGYDEALILNPNGSISETNSANIFLVNGSKCIKPASSHVLPGIMEQKVEELLLQWGYIMEKKILFPHDLFYADAVIITNSLMGAAPVSAMNGQALKHLKGLCESINEALL